MHGRPLLTGAAAFAAGIGMAALGFLPPVAALCLAALGIGALCVKKWPALFPVGLLLLGLSAGAVRMAAFRSVAPSDVSHLADGLRPVALMGTVGSDPEARPGGRVTFFFKADSASERGGSAAVSSAAVTGEVWVTLGPDATRSVLLDYGDAVRLTGQLTTPEDATNPGAFSWRGYLARRAVYCELRVKRPGAVVVVGGGSPNPLGRLAWSVRKTALQAIDSSLTPVTAAVLSGILIGRRSDLPPGLLADFVHTGTVHILASAGLHVGILAFWLERLLQKLTLPRKLQAVLLIAVLLLYALVCGGRPAVVRAVLMAGLYFGAALFEREPDGPTAVATSGLIILAGQPTALLEPGFQLSFLTIATLAVTMPVWNGFWRPRLFQIKPSWLSKTAEWAIDGFGLSLLAQLGALPVMAASYSEVSLTAWVANALVVPLLFLLIPLGFAGILLWSVSHALGAAVLVTAGCGVRLIARIVTRLGELPWAYFALPPPPLPLILLFYALVYGGTDAYQRVLGKQLGKQLGEQDHAPASTAGTARAGAGGVVGRVPPP